MFGDWNYVIVVEMFQCSGAEEDSSSRVYVSFESTFVPWAHSSSSICSAWGSCYFRAFVGSICKCWACNSSTCGLCSHSLRRKQQDYRERSGWWIFEVRYTKAHSASQLYLGLTTEGLQRASPSSVTQSRCSQGWRVSTADNLDQINRVADKTA